MRNSEGKERSVGVCEAFIDVIEGFMDVGESVIDVGEGFIDVSEGVIGAREGVIDVGEGLMDVCERLAGVWELLGVGKASRARRRLVVYAAAGCLFASSKRSVPNSRKVLCEEVCSVNIPCPPAYPLGVDIG